MEERIYTDDDYYFNGLCYSDYYKSVYGVRPREREFDVWVNMTYEEKEAHIEALGVQLQDNERIQKEYEAKALLKFKRRLQLIINTGAGNRETALRWLVQEEIFYSPQCVEQWVWELGIFFTDYGRALVNEICPLDKGEH
jgi:hypothetical protein